jgi:hypothetical protein
VPTYLGFERKETRLRLHQLTALTEHSRRLSRTKGSGRTRITENTVIRIAVDLRSPASTGPMARPRSASAAPSNTE